MKSIRELWGQRLHKRAHRRGQTEEAAAGKDEDDKSHSHKSKDDGDKLKNWGSRGMKKKPARTRSSTGGVTI